MLTRLKYRDWFGKSAMVKAPDYRTVPIGTPVSAFIGRALAKLGSPEAWSRDQWRDYLGGGAAPAQVMDPRRRAGVQQLLSVLPQSVTAVPDFMSFASEFAGVKEVVRWDLYSYKAYATGGATQISFFDQSMGNATAGILDTNMENGGSLPGGQYQVVMGVAVEAWPAAADVFVANALGKAGVEWWNVLTLGWFEAFINQKLYARQAPLWAIPQAMGPGTFTAGTAPSATAYSSNYLNSGHPSKMSRWELTPPWGIIGTRGFAAFLRWNSVQAVTTAGRIGIRYPGWQLRNVA